MNFGLFQAACLKKGEDHAVSSSQIVALTLINQAHATRDLKALLGADSCLSKWHDETSIKPMTVISLSQFKTIVRLKAKAGNAVAIEILDACADLGMTAFFNAAHGSDTPKEAAKEVADSRIELFANPWERLVSKDSLKLIHKFYGQRCGERFWWKYVYHWLTPVERCQLDQVNPILPSKQRKTRIHQWIVKEQGIRDRLQEKVRELLVLLGSATSKQDFETRYNRLMGIDQVEMF